MVVSCYLKYRGACLVTKSCPTLCDPIDCSPPGPSLHRDSPARILEWVAMPSSRDLLNPGIEPRSPILQADSLPPKLPGKPHRGIIKHNFS